MEYDLQSVVDESPIPSARAEMPNGEFFRQHLTIQLSHALRFRRQLAVLSIDLHNFTRLPDSLPREGLDTLLTISGRRLAAEIRDYDVGRVDGDRFLVLLSEIQDIHDVALIVERLVGALCIPIRLGAQELIPLPRVGIAVAPADGATADTLIRKAHAALNLAHDCRLGRYGFYTETMNERMLNRQVVERRLRHALANDAFEMVYQPKVALATGVTTGFEALIRWRDSELGKVSPATFVPLAEEMGLINDISRWVLKRVCAQSRDWQECGVPPLPISVNISGQDFLRSDFPDFITNVLLEHNISPQYLELEITEGVLIENLETARAMLEELRRVGVTIALDDFGTGYSSLAYLHRIPIDTVKIDRSFIENITSDWNSAAITSGVITLSHILNLNVVAEGVETEEQVELLKDQHCNEIQGGVYSMPLDAQSALRWLATERTNARR